MRRRADDVEVCGGSGMDEGGQVMELVRCCNRRVPVSAAPVLALCLSAWRRELWPLAANAFAENCGTAELHNTAFLPANPSHRPSNNPIWLAQQFRAVVAAQMPPSRCDSNFRAQNRKLTTMEKDKEKPQAVRTANITAARGMAFRVPGE